MNTRIDDDDNNNNNKVKSLQDIVMCNSSIKEHLQILNEGVSSHACKYFRASGFEIIEEKIKGFILNNKKEMIIKDANNRSIVISIEKKLETWCLLYFKSTERYLNNGILHYINHLNVIINFEEGESIEYDIKPEDLYDVLKLHFEDV